MEAKRMDKIRDKFNAMKESIDQADQRTQHAANELKQTEDRALQFENEAQSIKRRIQLLSEKLDETNIKVTEQEQRFGNISGKHQNDQAAGQELASLEDETEDQLSVLETDVREAQKLAEENQHKLVDAQRRHTVIERELSKTVEKAETKERAVKDLEDTISMMGGKLKQLSEKDEDASEREDDQEKEAKWLEEELQKKVQECEDLERDITKWDMLSGQTSDEIEGWLAKKKAVENEMEMVCDEVDEDF